jgi:hypothetical protein
MNNNLDSVVSKEKPIHLFTMILIFAGVCSGYYLWMVSNSTSKVITPSLNECI